MIDIVKAIIEVFSNDNNISTVIQRPDIPNNGSFPLMDITKLKKDIGFEPHYSNIVDMMEDYKCEHERGPYTRLFNVY